MKLGVQNPRKKDDQESTPFTLPSRKTGNFYEEKERPTPIQGVENKERQDFRRTDAFMENLDRRVRFGSNKRAYSGPIESILQSISSNSCENEPIVR